MKEFNTTAVCIPAKHYMVDISDKISEIRKLVDGGKYFTINRARQYGKTTTLWALQQALKDQYVVVSLSFESIGDAGFKTEGDFVQSFCRVLLDKCEFTGFVIPERIKNEISGLCARKPDEVKLDEMYRAFRRWMASSDKPIVLIIDEVDSATNNQVFLDMLGILRDGFISREKEGAPAFQSVVLAGVTDVKHLKSKIREEDKHKENSPWNIAADFLVDMSLSEDGIRGMLEEYAKDHEIDLNVAEMAKWLRDYTNGYPYLVSRICQLMDTQVKEHVGSLKEAWSKSGFEKAIKMLLSESNTLFDSLTGKLNNMPKMKEALREILINGEKLVYNADQKEIVQMQMYGFIRRDDNLVRVDNRIFETRMYNLFLSEDEMRSSVFVKESNLARNKFVSENGLDMRRILEGFVSTYMQVFGPLKDRFKEKDGRELFLLYLKPIINGTGNYYIEAQTRDQTRTDVIVDYLGRQYVIELKIWRGERYNNEGEAQIKEYLNYFNLDTGYMLSFNFNQKKETGVKRVDFEDKVLFEAMV